MKRLLAGLFIFVTASCFAQQTGGRGVPGPGGGVNCGGVPGGTSTTGCGGVPGNPGSSIPAAIHFWPMTEGSGSTLVDHIGTTNLTTTNITWSATPSGMGPTSTIAGFNGSSTFAQASAVDSTLNFNGTQPMTVAVWAYLGADSPSTIIGNLQTASNYQGWEAGIGGASNTPDLLVVGTVTSNQMTALGPTPGVTFTPYLLVWSYSGSLNLAGVMMYVNGINQVPLTDQSGTLTSGSTSTSPIFVGARNNSTDFYNGALAYMRVWNQVLTPTQISSLYALGPQ